MGQPSTNGVLLSSIPLNRKMKRYWISKYERIVRNCGADEACRKFKNLRVQVMTYIADENRRANLDVYLSHCGFRCNGYLRMLFEYAETQPHFVLDFLKIYSADQKATKSKDQASYETKKRLEQVKACPSVPLFLSAWLDSALASNSKIISDYRRYRSSSGSIFHKVASRLSLEDWLSYWTRWRHILQTGWQSSASLDYKPVFPEVYKDYVVDSSSSHAYRKDIGDLISMHLEVDDPPFTKAQLDFIDGFLNEEVADALDAAAWGDYESLLSDLPDLFRDCGWLSGKFVGQVQHIHKKGGGTDLRDIAVPNRFVQNALVPAADRMYNLVRKLPKDATFNQDRFNDQIQNRVNNSNLYQGSVDLSKATDNLPASWGFHIIEKLEANRTVLQLLKWRVPGTDELGLPPEIEDQDKLFKGSFDLFKTVARAKWEDEGNLLTWRVGQPLGSLPSFAMLSITHNLFMEALAVAMDLIHSPYFILGDDIVIANKKLRKRYIRELTSRSIPLSLHKSYEGRLTEFAGKIFVKGCYPFYSSDHATVTWSSLFDWQRSTGIRIPWNNLPRRIRKKLMRIINEKFGPFNKGRLVELARDCYALVHSCEIYGRGTHIYPDCYQDSDVFWRNCQIRYYTLRESIEKTDADPILHTGITMISNGHPVILMSTRFANKDGWFQRFRPVKLPTWFREKFRPEATDVLLLTACQALFDSST